MIIAIARYLAKRLRIRGLRPAFRRNRPACEALEGRQLLASNILFNPTGTSGGTPPLLIGSFDAAPGNALARASLPLTVGRTFQLDYQATVAGLIDPDGNAISPPGLNSTYQLTEVGSFTEVVTSVDPINGTATFALAPVQAPGSFFEVYYNPAVVADNLAGTGFTAGTRILTGRASPGQTNTGNFALALDGNNQPFITGFDQFGPDDYPGVLTVTGAGSALINVDVTSFDPAFFATPVVGLGFNTSTVTPFRTTDPARLVVGGPGGNAPGIQANVGAINGVTGPDFQFLADANNSFVAAAPAVAVVKATNGVVAPTAPGPVVGVGSTVTWTYAVSNPGNEPLKDVVLVDDGGTPGDTTDDFRPTPVTSGGLNVGDANRDGLLDPGETFQFAATGIARAGQYENRVVVTALGNLSNGPVTAASLSHYFAAAPAITIVKATNGVVAPTAPGPVVAVGSTVTWTYDVTNPGNEPLRDLVVVDDNGTPGDTADDFRPTFAGGDANGNGQLDPGETFRYTATGTARAGQYENRVAVTGVGVLSGQTVTSGSIGHYFAATPAIAVVKATNGVVAPTPPGPTVAVGGAVTWTYDVTNPGNEPLRGVFLVDDNGTPGDTSDDFRPTFAGGDSDGNGLLDPGETFRYTAGGTARAGQYENRVVATGVGVLSGTTVTAGSIGHYFAPIPTPPAIAVVKATNGVVAPTAPGPIVGVGGAVTWTYDVTNPGAEPLRGVFLVDDNGTLGDTSDDFRPTFAGGDSDGDGLLDPGETFRYTAGGTARAGQYENRVVATGVGATSGTTVTAGSIGHYFAATPTIAVVKATNGVVAPTPPGPTVNVGSTVTWTYDVTNPGNEPLRGVVLVDDAGTPSDPSDDFRPTFVGGDSDGDGLLDPSETFRYTAGGTARAGQYENRVVATGVGVLSGVTVSAGSIGHYTAPGLSPQTIPSVSIVKATNGVLAGTGPGPTVFVGTPVTFTYFVANSGSVPLANVSVGDNNGTPGDTSDDFRPTFVGGDLNGNSLLEPGEVWIYTATRAATEGPYTNFALVAAQGPTGTPVSSGTISSYVGVCPMVVAVRRVGVHDQRTRVVVTFDGPVDPALAEDPARYRLSEIGGDGRFSRRDPIETAVYDPATNSVTLTASRRINVHHLARLRFDNPCPGGPDFDGILNRKFSLGEVTIVGRRGHRFVFPRTDVPAVLSPSILPRSLTPSNRVAFNRRAMRPESGVFAPAAVARSSPPAAHPGASEGRAHHA